VVEKRLRTPVVGYGEVDVLYDQWRLVIYPLRFSRL